MQRGALKLQESGRVDQVFMDMAVGLARQAAVRGEVPVGAVVVHEERVIGSGSNAPIGLNDPTAHAEVVALRAAAHAVANYRLPDTTVYVSVEPCVMCVGAMIQARVARVVFGCAEPKAGALGSVYDLGRDDRGNHQLEVSGGVCATEAAELLRTFFRMRRGA